ncbi:hypothetical protein Bbelb_291610 [Branchiostoma belcheri]|nr:hypothetical protein Bbelb_291610 [Branchiostoma belcheri]
MNKRENENEGGHGENMRGEEGGELKTDVEQDGGDRRFQKLHWEGEYLAIVTHELKKHNLVVNETVESSSDTFKEHYVFNYHNAKLGMSLLLTNIQDVTKEGDGERYKWLHQQVRSVQESRHPGAVVHPLGATYALVMRLMAEADLLNKSSPEGEDAMDVESWITSWPGVRENRDISSGRDREAKKRD